MRPRFDPTSLDLTDFDVSAMLESDAGRAARTAVGTAVVGVREVTYVTVGFAVLGLRTAAGATPRTGQGPAPLVGRRLARLRQSCRPSSLPRLPAHRCPRGPYPSASRCSSPVSPPTPSSRWARWPSAATDEFEPLAVAVVRDVRPRAWAVPAAGTGARSRASRTGAPWARARNRSSARSSASGRSWWGSRCSASAIASPFLAIVVLRRRLVHGRRAGVDVRRLRPGPPGPRHLLGQRSIHRIRHHHGLRRHRPHRALRRAGDRSGSRPSARTAW